MESIAVGKCIHLLSRIEDKALDRFWQDTSAGKYPIIDLEGNMGYSLSDQDGLLFVRNDFTASTYEDCEFVFGNLFLPDTVQELLSRDKVLILMVYRKTTRNLLLSELEADARYMLDLPHGLYSFFVLVLDAGAKDLLDSRIYAVGLPCKENLNRPELEKFYLEHPADIREFVDSAPIDIKRGGPFYLNLIMIDAEKIPDCPMLFSEFLQEDEPSPPL
ncbi:hypothetical protein MSHOH_0902 [Methanosarcina horonobensis HB-1 = JCM 15518]|uniref:Uncharacterized protein n=1 Tax=Methanosarcina horonobensis HB-1 = JCM 15518 TaxID=1434110 RepID=A0A0E3WSU9_9EURY|nr:hypothetical protein MSHOH_0902 [Methanosarcina horonobensis HB-1 = JCM 15518]